MQSATTLRFNFANRHYTSIKPLSGCHSVKRTKLAVISSFYHVAAAPERNTDVPRHESSKLFCSISLKFNKIETLKLHLSFFALLKSHRHSWHVCGSLRVSNRRQKILCSCSSGRVSDQWVCTSLSQSLLAMRSYCFMEQIQVAEFFTIFR